MQSQKQVKLVQFLLEENNKIKALTISKEVISSYNKLEKEVTKRN